MAGFNLQQRRHPPVCSSLGMVGGAALIDKPDSESSSLVGMTAGGGVTADSWT